MFSSFRVLWVSCALAGALIETVCSTTCDGIPLMADLLKRSVQYESQYFIDQSEPMVSDELLVEGWYRSVDAGYQYLIPDSSTVPDVQKCGTYFPVYISGTHPDITTLDENPIDAVACLRLSETRVCDIEYNIKIKKCGIEVIYYLSAPREYSAFCFEQGEDIYGIEARAPENVDFGTVSVLYDLKYTDDETPYLEFACDFTIDDNTYTYTVNWYIADALVISYKSDDVANLVLLEDVLIENGFKLSINIKCGVNAAWSEESPTTNMSYSDNFYAGAKIPDTTVYLNKNTETTLTFTLTVPIGTGVLGLPFPLYAPLVTLVEGGNHDTHECETKSLVSKQPDSADETCNTKIEMVESAADWDPSKEYSFKIATTDIDYADTSVFTVKLKFKNDIVHKIFKDYILPDITVIVLDTELYKNRLCYSHIDPHLRTSDGYYYDQQHEGTFLLYYNTRFGIEVQERTKQCNSVATCACGLNIRAGKDVFRIDKCGQINYIGFVQCGDGGILDVVKINDYHYKFERYGKFFYQPNKIYRFMVDDNDLFCVCEDGDVICAGTQFLQCTKSKSVTRTKCDTLTNKRRATGKATGKELERLNRLMQPMESKILNKREVAVDITADEAMAVCTAKLSGALVVRDFPTMIGGESVDEVISQCAYDVEVSDDISLANVHVDALNSIAKNMLDLEPAFAENNTEATQYLIANTCIGNCSDHGQCSSLGDCVCDDFYGGSDCSADLRAKLNIDDIEGGGECDLADDLDCDCFYIRTDNLMSGFKYTVNEYAVTVEGVTNKVATRVNTGQQEDIFTGICCVASAIQKRSVSNDGIAVLYELSISNDGVTFSDTKSVYVFNSECQTLQSTQNGDTIVELQPNYCYIDGVCVYNDTQHPSDDCKLCNTEASRLAWTNVCGTDADGEENEGARNHDSGKNGINLKLIIGTVSGIVGAIVLVIVVVVVIKQCIKTRPKVTDTNSGNDVPTEEHKHDSNSNNRFNRPQSVASIHFHV